MKLTRRVSFSSGHRYWIPAKSEEENRALFGQWASPFNHGHNYALEVTVSGQVDLVTGMVVNIKDIDDVLQRTIVEKFDGRSINDEIDHFQSHASSTENIMLYIAEVLSGGVLPSEVELVSLKLEETPLLYGQLTISPKRKMTLTRVYEFAASHRLHSPALSDQTNLDLFGKCNNAAGHGHNYLLEVTVEGEPDTQTGMMVDLGTLDQKVNELVVDRYDHKNFNVDIPEFDGRPTTSEVVAQEIFDRLAQALPAKLHRIRLHETARNIFEVEAA
jgi:6-pyruvoyltetrahydropterin/6-carboxytetrahydropterin synthase